MFILRPILVEMSRNLTVMNEVNNFASVNSNGHCGKSKHFALDFRILLGLDSAMLSNNWHLARALKAFPCAQLLTSNWR